MQQLQKSLVSRSDHLQDKFSLPDEKTMYRGCIFCDKSISHLINLHHAYSAEQPIRRNMNMKQKRGGSVLIKRYGRIVSKR